jgi:protoporphyrinogen oxidase
LEGGSITLVNALIDGIQAHAGRIHLSHPAVHVTSHQGRVTGVQTRDRHFPAEAVICTVPTPLVSGLVPDLPTDWKEHFDAIHNIGVICVIFKLSRSVSPHFWVNVSEPDIDIPGVIEFTNLRSVGGDTIVYVPYYMPVTNKKFSWPDDALLAEAFACLKLINPLLSNSDIIATKVARLRYGQPICEPGFASRILPVQTPIAGLQIADTCYYYPEDRGIAESVRLGSQMATALGTPTVEAPHSSSATTA